MTTIDDVTVKDILQKEYDLFASGEMAWGQETMGTERVELSGCLVGGMYHAISFLVESVPYSPNNLPPEFRSEFRAMVYNLVNNAASTVSQITVTKFHRTPIAYNDADTTTLEDILLVLKEAIYAAED